MTSIFAEVGGTRQIYLLKKVKMVTLFLLTELNFGHKTSCAMVPCWSSGFPCCTPILGALLQCVHWNSNSKMEALLYMEHLGTDLNIKGTSVITKETSEGLCIPPYEDTYSRCCFCTSQKPASEDTNGFVPQPQISAFLSKD